MKRYWLLPAAAGVCILSLLSTGCGNANSSTPVDRTSERGYIRIATVQFEAPLFYQRGQEKVGIEAELINRVAQKLNEGLERPNELLWVKREYNTLISAVANGEVEMAAGAIGVDDARSQQVAFTDSYYKAELVLIMNPGYKRIEADKLDGQRLGVRAGTLVEEWAKQTYPNAQIVPFKTLDNALLDLRQAQIEGVIDDRGMAAYALDTVTGMSRMEILPGTLGSFDVAIAVPVSNQTLLRTLNEVIAEARNQGELERLTQEHMGDRVAKVEKRYVDRVERERLAVAPRRFSLTLSKESGSTFDIYKLANLSFSLRHEQSGKSYYTSKLQFRKKNGFTGVSVPPGRYRLHMPSKFGGSEVGSVLIKKDDPDRVSYNLRLKADDTISLLASN